MIAPDHLSPGTGKLLKKESAASQNAISGKYLVMPGDVIYSKIRPYLRKAYKCDFRALCSADMYPLSPRPGTDPSFVLHSLLGQDFTDFAASVSARSGIPKINREELAEFRLYTPNPGEQRAIGQALDDADRSISTLERLIAKKQAIKQGMMQQLLTGRTRLSTYCRQWEDRAAGDIGEFKGGSGFPIRFQGETSGEYPFYKVSDMNSAHNGLFMTVASNYISEHQRKQISAVVMPANAIIFAKVGAAVFLERKRILTRPSCVDNNMAAFTVDETRADVRFIYYLLELFPMSSLVATGALPSLNGRQLRSIPLSLPSDLAEQRAISSVLTDVDAELEVLRARAAKARDIKTGMMQQLLTGRTRLPVEAGS
ncbi:restriction endonuclease subunit S [Gordonia sp. VNQ95]|uniref:restriction endonuclease subunit S n=1 Tax=Gordonia sp. VNQ95 TaxID=3156619 RepID=UPI0032B598F0